MSRNPLRDRRGMSAVEFALIAPVLLLLLGCVADMGMALRARFNLSSALAAASSYTLNNAGSVSAANGPALATALANLLASASAANWANANVNVNNGPTAAMNNGAVTTAGSASAADSCYCPGGSKSALVWGAPVACGSACPSGALAGKFVLLTASKAFTPLILPAGLIASPITGSSVVQVQ